MLRFHTLVLTSDNSLRQSLRRLGVAISSTLEFQDNPGAFVPAPPLDLLIVDLRDPRFEGLPRLLGREDAAGVPTSTRVIYLIEDGQLIDRLDLFQSETTASLLCHSAHGHVDEEELIATATKLLRGELFGLQKYLPWGVTTFTVDVRNYEEKDRALQVITDFGAMAGWRGPLRERIQLVCDELMMNALYHAPVDDKGRRLNEGKSAKEMAHRDLQPILIQYGSSGRYFGVAVRDGYGSLQRPHLLGYLLRSRAHPAEVENKTSGAGLGLVLVLRSASKLVFNIAPGHATEVIALFDRELLSRGQNGARSVHLFSAALPGERDATSAPAAASDPEAAPPPGVTPPTPPPPRALLPLLLLLVLFAALVLYQIFGPKLLH